MIDHINVTCRTRDEFLKFLVDVEEDEVRSAGVEDALLVEVPHVVGHVTLDTKRVPRLSFAYRHVGGLNKRVNVSGKRYSLKVENNNIISVNRFHGNHQCACAM